MTAALGPSAMNFTDLKSFSDLTAFAMFEFLEDVTKHQPFSSAMLASSGSNSWDS